MDGSFMLRSDPCEMGPLKDAGYKPGEFKFKEIRHMANTLLKDANIPAEKNGYDRSSINKVK